MCVVDPGVQCKKHLNVAIVFHIEQKENKRERTWFGGGSDTIKIRKGRQKKTEEVHLWSETRISVSL